MKAELQIGDWVKYGSTYIKVESITKKKIGYHKEAGESRLYYVRLCEVEPIPLKRVHLTKNGFRATNADDTEFVYRDGYEINVIFTGGYLDPEPIISLSIKFAEKDLWMDIEYVHELQDAMRLLGCDKKIEL